MAFPESWLAVTLAKSAGCPAYPAYVPDVPLPFVAFRREGTERERYLEGSAAVPLATFEVNVYAAGYLEAKTIADRLRLGVDNFAGLGEGCIITDTRVTAEADGDPEFNQGEDSPAAYVVNMTVEIRFREDS